MEPAAALAQSNDVWDALGPYLLTGLGVLAMSVVGVMWKDLVWLKKNLTNVMVELGIKPVGE